MKNLKKVLAIVLSFAMLLGLASTASAAIVIDDGGVDDTINATFYDGETAIPEISTSVSKGAVITLPSYSKSGYELDGWKVNGEGELLAVGSSYTVNEAVNFYAQFSVSASIAVVTIQGGSTTYWSTMEKARVAALQAGDTPVTIQLLSDASIDARLQLRDPDSTSDTTARNITIDLNGFTLSKAAAMNGFFFINKQATLTVKGGTLDCKSYGGYMFAGNSGSTTIVESGTYTNFGSIASTGAAEGLKISGGTWDAPPIDNLADGYEIIKNADGIHFDVVAKAGDDIYSLSDGTNEATFASMDALQVAIDYFAGKRTNIKLLKDVTTDARIGLVAGTETVPIDYSYDLNGHKLTYTGTSQGFVLVRAYDSFNINDTADGGGVTVSGQSYYFTSNKNPGKLTVNAGTYAGATSFANSNTQLVINGGTWNIDPTTYVDATKYEVVESSGTYTVKPLVQAEASWTVDGVLNYGTFDEAMTAAIAGTNATVKLLQDCAKTEAVTTVPSGTTLTLNLNGKNLTNTYTGDSATSTNRRFFVVANGGVLYIVDNSAGEPGTMTGHANYTNNAAIAFAQKGGKVYITGGKFHEGAGQSGNNQGFSRQTTSPAGMFYISGGYFTSNTKPGTAYLAENYEFVSDSTYEGYTYMAREIPPKEYAAEVTIDGTTTPYESFDAAIEAAAATTSSATIKLLMDCKKTSKATTVAADTTVTLDLNGKNLTNTYTNTTASSTNHRYFSVAGTLNIVDTAKGGSITGNNNYTGSGAVASATATGSIVVTADSSFYNGAAQAVDTNNNRAFSRASSSCPITISAGWYTDISKPANGYLDTGYNRVEVADASKAAAPITLSTTTKTINYLKNGGAGTDVQAQTYAYLTGYITLLNTRSLSYTKKDHVCVGWSTNSKADPEGSEIIGGGDPVNFADETKFPGNSIDLYAIYKEVDPSMWVCIDTDDPTVGYADLASAFVESTDVTLIKNISGRTTIEVSGDRRLNLNGYNITANTPENPTGSAIVVKISSGALSIYNEDAKIDGFTFGGDGTVTGYAQGTGGAIDVIGSVGASVKIYGGTFTGDAPTHGTVLVCSGVGKAYIYGGEFIPANPTSSVDTLYANTGKIFIMPSVQSDVKIQGVIAKNTSGTIGIVGGYFSELQPNATFGTYDPVNDRMNSDTTKGLRKLSGNDDYSYMVAPSSANVADDAGNTYATFEEALAAVSTKEDAELIIASDVTLSGAVSYSNDISLNLNGFNMTGDMAVADNKMLSLSNATKYNGTITSTGFVYIDGVLTTTGVVNQTATAQRVEKMGGDITDTLGATIIGRIALKPGDAYPSLTYVDPVDGTTKTLDSSNKGNGVWTYDLDNIYVNYIAADLKLQFMQGQENVGEEVNYSLLDYYEACYTGGKDAKLDAILANTIYYAHELYLMSGKGAAFDLPDWVAGAKKSDAPVAGDNVMSTVTYPTDATNFKIKTATVNVTMKSGLMFTVIANDTTTKAVTLEVAKGSGTPASYVISPNSPTPGVESAGNGLYNVKIDKISPTDYATTYTVTLKVGDTVNHQITYSVNSYCYRMQASETVVGQTTAGSVALALYNFGKAALAYTAK